MKAGWISRFSDLPTGRDWQGWLTLPNPLNNLQTFDTFFNARPPLSFFSVEKMKTVSKQWMHLCSMYSQHVSLQFNCNERFLHKGYARYQRYQLLFCFYRWHSRRQIPFTINRWRWW
jgi:hypothetical protein